MSFFSSLFSHKPNPKELIIGKWEEIDGKGTIEFFKDGTTYSMGGEAVINGTYKLIKKDQIKMVIKYIILQDIPFVQRVLISEDRISLTTHGAYAKPKKNYRKVI